MHFKYYSVGKKKQCVLRLGVAKKSLGHKERQKGLIINVMSSCEP